MQWLYIKYIFIGLLTHTFKLKPAFPYYTICQLISALCQAKDKEELLRILKSSSYLHNNESKSIFTNGIKESIPINHTEGKECEEGKVMEEVSYHFSACLQMMKRGSALRNQPSWSSFKNVQ